MCVWLVGWLDHVSECASVKAVERENVSIFYIPEWIQYNIDGIILFFPFPFLWLKLNFNSSRKFWAMNISHLLNTHVTKHCVKATTIGPFPTCSSSREIRFWIHYSFYSFRIFQSWRENKLGWGGQPRKMRCEFEGESKNVKNQRSMKRKHSVAFDG